MIINSEGWEYCLFVREKLFRTSQRIISALTEAHSKHGDVIVSHKTTFPVKRMEMALVCYASATTFAGNLQNKSDNSEMH